MWIPTKQKQAMDQDQEPVFMKHGNTELRRNDKNPESYTRTSEDILNLQTSEGVREAGVKGQLHYHVHPLTNCRKHGVQIKTQPPVCENTGNQIQTSGWEIPTVESEM